MLVWGEHPWGARRLLSHIMGIPPHVSALARKQLGNAAGWDVHTEATAASVDWLQIIARGIAGMGGAKLDNDFEPYPRPFDTSPNDPAPAVGLAGLADFLEGQN